MSHLKSDPKDINYYFLHIAFTHTLVLFKGTSVLKNVIMEKELLLPVLKDHFTFLFSHRTCCSNKNMW